MNSLLLLVVALCAAPGPGWSQVIPSPVNPLPVSGQCQLQGYDLHRLTSVDHWTFNVPDKLQWLIPSDISEADVASVDVSMSLCKPLPSGNCKANENSTVCEHITLSNGTVIDIDLASFNKSDKFEELDESAGVAGFSVQQKSQIPINYTACDEGLLTTVLGFRCDQSAKWSNTDVTNYVYADEHSVFPCVNFIIFKYNGSCYSAPTVAPANCQLDGYNTSTLSKQPFWFANVPHTVCFNGTQDSVCTIFFSFCHAIPEDTTGIFNLDTCVKENAGVCQIGESSDGNRESEYSMGQYRETTRFVPNDESVNGGFHLEFLNGSKPNNNSNCNFNSYIILGCNKSVQWPDSGDLSDLIVPIYDEHCQWVFELQYDGACVSEFPIVNNGDVASPVGWILMGLCGLAVLIYLAVGMSIQYFVKGARGSDIIPHVTFWAGVFSLVTEGCRYTLDIVTCFQFKDGFKRSVRSTSGVQYDQI